MMLARNAMQCNSAPRCSSGPPALVRTHEASEQQEVRMIEFSSSHVLSHVPTPRSYCAHALHERRIFRPVETQMFELHPMTLSQRQWLLQPQKRSILWCPCKHIVVCQARGRQAGHTNGYLCCIKPTICSQMTDGPDSSQHPVEEKPVEFVKNSNEIYKV